MTFNPDADISGHRTRRRGRTAAVAGGGVVGLGAIAVLVVSLLSGGEIDLSPFLGGGTGDQGSSSSEGTLDECDSGADANAKVECRIAGSQVALDEYWSGQLDGYTEPGMIVVDGQTSTACGTASNAVGPFYCPADATVYIDPTFFAVMQQQFGASAGDLAQLYIVGHEWGHHIQNTTGTMAEYPNNGTGPASNGVRMELQADCYAGAWIGDMTEATDADGDPYLETPTETQLEDALNAALVVGDDHIQEMSGFSNPESFTHGSSAQRQFWFANGYESGLGVCDTFAVPDSQLEAG
ncbi:neutral zinc metallopeptidase [Microbacterium sp. M28]|uniref:KPN_02809 family neutral zinc metallopeptidase n=1 Tax=Microbacterium sp. M28 TaxID=2962064 RepID=UPI0021F4988B|nr:neutral zinc metallopeptidase [Microbacterium sp. M28]UYO96668.1 neutral zinc metallopeptidase [Microbacterium sp. M28]